jgi:ATP-dependent DNA ligase
LAARERFPYLLGLDCRIELLADLAGHRARPSGADLAQINQVFSTHVALGFLNAFEPKFFADVEYRDITSEGLLRQSSFKGLSRDDKS